MIPTRTNSIPVVIIRKKQNNPRSKRGKKEVDRKDSRKRVPEKQDGKLTDREVVTCYEYNDLVLVVKRSAVKHLEIHAGGGFVNTHQAVAKSH